MLSGRGYGVSELQDNSAHFRGICSKAIPHIKGVQVLRMAGVPKPLLQPLSPFLIFQLLYRLKNEGPRSTPRITSTNKAIIITEIASISMSKFVLPLGYFPNHTFSSAEGPSEGDSEKAHSPLP